MSADEDPVAWLRAAITERLELARAACGRASRPPAWVVRGAGYAGVMISRDIDGQPVVFYGAGPSDAEAALISANDPQDTIARCEAELGILDLYEQQAAKAAENAMQEDRAWTLWPVIALLAGGYRHRPGYPGRFAITPQEARAPVP